MADIQWPDGLRGPLIDGRTRQETVGFLESPVTSGPSFVEPLSDDTPVLASVTFLFNSTQAREFQAWLRANQIKFRSPFFDCPIQFEDRTVETQECRFTVDGYPQLSGMTRMGLYSYTAQVYMRKIITDWTDFPEEELAAAGAAGCKGTVEKAAGLIDEGVNLGLPEV